MILVAGATGQLGGAVTSLLLASGRPVRVLVRAHSNDQELARAGAQVALGDLRDCSSLEPACRGVETVITTANSALRGGDDNVETVDRNGNRHLIDAAKAAGVKQFVFVSALVADPDSPVPFLSAKGMTEDYLRASGVPYTIIAPNAFMEFWIGVYIGMPILRGQPVTLVGEGRRRHSFISASDVARFAVAAVDYRSAVNRKLLLGGPEPFSFRDAIATYQRALGREIPVRSVSPGAPVPLLPEGAWGIAGSFELFDSPVDMTEASRTYGVTLTSLETFVRRSLERPGVMPGP
jgi:NADH dehydrogenase